MQMRWLYVICAIAGCGFDVESAPDPGDDEAVDPGDPGDPGTPGTPTQRRCATDADLRMCIDFDDATGVPTVFTDGSGNGNDATLVTDVAMMTRDAELAAELTSTSRLHVAESIGLDIAEEITLSLWARLPGAAMPGIDEQRWLIDNEKQYGAYITNAGVVACRIADTTVVSTPIIAPDTWHHIACTYDGDDIVVYVDGYALGCDELDDDGGPGGGGPGPGGGDDDLIPTDGREGLAIGADLRGGLRFENAFIGGLDNVQVFARAFSDAEVCSSAGGTSCAPSAQELCSDQ